MGPFLIHLPHWRLYALQGKCIDLRQPGDVT